MFYAKNGFKLNIQNGLKLNKLVDSVKEKFRLDF